MNSNRKRWQQRSAVVMGGLLAFAMLASAILPLIRNNITQPNAIIPTATPAATQPAPIADLNSIQFTETYLHPSGLFTVGIPTGWIPQDEFSTTGEAQVTMRNSAALSVVELRVLRPVEGVELTPEGLKAYFNESWLQASWREYTSFEKAREVVDGDKLVSDFNLRRQNQDYIARQNAFTDGTWIYLVRVVTPSNASQMLQYILEQETATLQPIERFIGSALEWGGYFDSANRHLIRFPGTWQVADSSAGAPASITGENIALRVSASDGTIASEDAASAFVAGLRSNIEVKTVESAEQFGVAGYRVSYTLPNLDGGSQSGVVLLLNGSEKTHVANLLFTNLSNTDVLTMESPTQAVTDGLAALASFSLFPDLEVSNAD